MKQQPTRRAFSLVELLVVVGIIAVLIALLVPAFNRAREEARAVQCMSNLHQLSAAMIAYCADNEDFFPTPSLGGWQAADWVYWQAGQNLSGSRIARYVNGDLRKILICPSDDTSYHTDQGTGAYPYSYSVNEFMSRATPVWPTHVPIRLTHVENPSTKIMLIDESSSTIDDACWAPQNYPLDGHNLLSNRHDRRAETSSDPNAGKGALGYTDGHAAFVPRLDTTKQENYIAFVGEPVY